MSGIDDLLAESHDRWVRATKRAQGIEDLGLGQAIKTYYTRYFPFGVFALMAAGVVAGLVVVADTTPDWATSFAFGSVLVAFGSVIGGLVYNAKKVAPAARLATVDVLFYLNDQERKHIQRQVLGKAALDHEHLAVVRAAAVQLRKGHATQLILAPFSMFLLLSQAANWTVRGGPLAWIMATAGLAMTIGMLFMGRDFRRAGRFLRSNPEDAATHAR
jgi:hypothetical protein